jgi:hypothetical protein
MPRSSNRHLTVGLAVTGRHPASRTGPDVDDHEIPGLGPDRNGNMLASLTPRPAGHSLGLVAALSGPWRPTAVACSRMLPPGDPATGQ